MKIKRAISLILSGSCFAGAIALSGCSGADSGLDKFEDTARPDVESAYATREEALAAGGGWYQTMNVDFEDNQMPEYWHCSPHGQRRTEYWCDNLVSFEDGKCLIKAYHSDSNPCGICPASGNFTGGIETSKTEDGTSWTQAFGYYEVRVKLPETDGMWSAFWIQSENMGMIGNGGEDGSEIDIFESSFWNKESQRTYVGNCIHWDGYDRYHQSVDAKTDTGINLYDGNYHTFGLRWSPTEYVFYVDGTAMWATNAGGVSKVPEYLRLTNEIRDGVGPYGIRMKDFTATEENPGIFYIDWIHVYQNTAYEPYIKSVSDFTAPK